MHFARVRDELAAYVSPGVTEINTMLGEPAPLPECDVAATDYYTYRSSPKPTFGLTRRASIWSPSNMRVVGIGGTVIEEDDSRASARLDKNFVVIGHFPAHSSLLLTGAMASQ